MIRDEAMREKIKSLWKLCFNDSDEFTDMYFRLRYSNEVNIAIQSGEEVIAALQILPYPMTFGKSEIKTGYVSGACTHPDYRNRGAMRELLRKPLPVCYTMTCPFPADSGRTLVVRVLCRYGLHAGI